MNGKKIAIIVSVAAAVTAGAGAGTYAYVQSNKNDDRQVVRTAEVTTEKVTTEKATKATTKATTEKATTEKAKKEKSTKAATTEAQKMAEATTTEYVAPTEMPTEAQTEAPYVPETEAPTERATEAPTERTTQAPTTEKATEAATKHVHSWEIYDQETEDHRFGNTCGADITGIETDKHIKASGTTKVNLGTKDDPDWAVVYNCSGATHDADVVVSTTWICYDCGKTVTTNGEDMP